MKRLTHPIGFSITVFLIFSILAVYITYPLIFHLTNYATGLADEYLIAWIMDWNMHAFFTSPLQIFNANIYYPYTNTLAYSDAHFISSLLSLIPFWILHEPVVSINFTFISSLIFLGFSMYLLAYYLTKNKWAALIVGVMIIFSPAVLDKRVHLQILAIEWVPLALLFFIRFLETTRLRYLLISLLFFVMQTYNSFLPGYFIIFSFAILVVFYILHKKNWKQFFHNRFIIPCIIAGLVLIPIVIPYYQVSNEFHFVRDIRETIHLALQPEDYLFPGDTTKLHDILLSLQQMQTFPKTAETKPGYVGLAFTIIGLISLVYFIKKFKKISWQIQSFITISLFGFVMSLGPALHLHRVTIHHPFLIPLPYGLFYYAVPGFKGMRNSARWEMLFIIGLLIVISFFLKDFFKKFPQKIQYVLIILIIGVTILEFNPIHYSSIQTKEQFPIVYSWLATTSPYAKIIELPIYNWYISPYVLHENEREYFSTEHFRSTVNGASGFTSPPWQEMVNWIWQTFPSNKTIAKFKQMGITYIIIHKDEFDTVSKANVSNNGAKLPNGNVALAFCNASPSLKLVKQFGNDYVYQIK